MLRFLELRRPKVSKFFSNTVMALQERMRLDGETLKQVGKIALASERVYFDAPFLVPLADSRGELGLFAEAVRDLAERHPGVAHVFLQRYPSLPWPIARYVDGLRKFGDNCRTMGKSAVPLFRLCIDTEDQERMVCLLESFGTIAEEAPGLAADLQTLLTQKKTLLPNPILVRWLRRGCDLLTSRRVEEGTAYLRFQSRESRRLLGLHYAVLADMRNVLEIYGSSLAGRSLTVVNLDASPYGVQRPYTDGKTLCLPPRISYFEREDENRRAFTVIAAVQAAFIAHGTFGLNLETLPLIPEIHERYGTVIPDVMDYVRRKYRGRSHIVRDRPTGEVEVVFQDDRTIRVTETPHESLFLLFPTPDLAEELFSLVETVRVEASLCRKYAGLARDVETLNHRLWSRRREVGNADALQEELEDVVEGLVQCSLTEDWHGRGTNDRLDARIRGAAAQLAAVRRPGTTVESTVEACFHIYGELYDAYPLVPYANQRNVRELFSGIGKATVVPELAFDASSELFAVTPKHPRYEETSHGEERDIDLTSLSRREQGLKRLQKTLIQGSIQIHRYPEWSVEKGLFLDRHCTLFENVVVPGSPDYYRNVVDEYELVYKKIRKRFLYLRNEEVEVSRRWLDGDDIHLGDAVDYAIDLLRGAEANDKIYQVKRQNTRDIAVGILVDCSSSTEEKIGQRRIIDIEKAALSLLASALHLVGDTFGVFTFFSMGRRNVFFNVVKDFSEPWNALTQSRVDSIQAYAGNRDGCAVRHIAGRLLQRPEKTKLLLMLSDGVPADAGYGGSSSAETSRYAIEDTRRAILEARGDGIVPYCVTIDRFAKRYIPHLYGERHHCLIDDVVKLPDRMWRLYARLTA